MWFFSILSLFYSSILWIIIYCYFVEMSWKGPIFAQGLWPSERPARWTKDFIGQGITEMLATKVNRYKLIIKEIMSMINYFFFLIRKRRKTSKGFNFKKADLKPAVRYPKKFWMKLLHAKRSYRGTNKINSRSSNRDNPGTTNSLMRKLGTCENSCIRKVPFYFNFEIRQTFILGQALLSANSVYLISSSCQLAEKSR